MLFACGPPPLEPRDPTPGLPHFRVQTYNVELTEYSDESTVDAVGAADADVVALQEVTPEWEDVLRERYSDRYPHMLFETDGGAGGLAVLSKYPLVDRGLLLGPGDWHPAWHVVVHTPMGPVQLLDVHLRPMFSGGGGAAKSYLTAGDDHQSQVELYTDDCTDLPTLILGDFNESPDGDAVKWLEGQGFRNALPLFHPGQETWRFRSVGNQLGETIDHIMFDDAFEPLNAYVEVQGDSDHIPVVAHFEPSQIVP